MAGEAAPGTEVVTETQAVTPDALKGSGDDGSLASILEQAPHLVFSGHPALGEDAGGEPGPGEGTKTPEEIAAEQAAAGKPPEPPEPPKPPEKKYKSWEEAEEGAREHQSAFTRKAEEAIREKESRETAERERDELRQRLEAKEAKPPEKPVDPTKTPEELEAEQEARIEAALGEIGQLDDTDPNYQKSVAKAWRKAGIGAANAGEIAKEAARQVREEIKAEAEATRHVREYTDIRTQAGVLAGNAGLNMEEGSADHILFWSQAGKVPQEMRNNSFGEQVNWTVNEVRRLKGQVVQTKAQLDEIARQEQARNTVLERGANRPQVPVKAETVSLGAILNSHKESRRI